MSEVLTFLDAGGLLSAARLSSPHRLKALTLLADSRRKFVTTDFIKRETTLKCDYHGYRQQVEFYEDFFENVDIFLTDVEPIIAGAYQAGKQYGLNALNALHISAALLAQADEFVTTGRPNSPFQNVRGLKILSLP
jgi:hypothetical protein